MASLDHSSLGAFEPIDPIGPVQKASNFSQLSGCSISPGLFLVDRCYQSTTIHQHLDQHMLFYFPGWRKRRKKGTLDWNFSGIFVGIDQGHRDTWVSLSRASRVCAEFKQLILFWDCIPLRRYYYDARLSNINQQIFYMHFFSWL